VVTRLQNGMVEKGCTDVPDLATANFRSIAAVAVADSEDAVMAS